MGRDARCAACAAACPLWSRPLPTSWQARQADQCGGVLCRVAVMEVARPTRKVVCSMLRAEENDALRQLEVGSLVRCAPGDWVAGSIWGHPDSTLGIGSTGFGSSPMALPGKGVEELLKYCPVAALACSGTVRRVEPFGVFVGIDGTRTSGLLHISNVSRQHIDQAAFVNVSSASMRCFPVLLVALSRWQRRWCHCRVLQNVFSTGDKVRCLVMGLDPDYSNISLSTAELEPKDGDMLSNKQCVWDAAGERRPLSAHRLCSYWLAASAAT